jgi:hypothetical protein
VHHLSTSLTKEMWLAFVKKALLGRRSLPVPVYDWTYGLSRRGRLCLRVEATGLPHLYLFPTARLGSELIGL